MKSTNKSVYMQKINAKNKHIYSFPVSVLGAGIKTWKKSVKDEDSRTVNSVVFKNRF